MNRYYFLLFLIGLLLVSCHGPQSLENQRIENLLQKMTLRQKIGQMFLVGIDSQEINQDLKRAIAKDYLSGFYLLPDKNFTNVNAAARLIYHLQKVALASIEIPLFISTRQEGGLVQSLNHSNGATETPGNYALSINGSFEDTYSVYRIMARELRATGFNLALAPLVNLPPENASIPTRLRLFSADSDLVAKLSQAAVRGFQQNGIISAAGFFPEISTDTKTILQSGKIKSRAGFQAVISEDVSGIILTNQALLSENRIKSRLKREFGFKNLLISDDLTGATVDTIIKAIQNGINLIFQQSSKLGQIRDQIDAVQQAVKSGRLSAKKIDQSVKKILNLKSAYGLFERSIVDLLAIEKRVGTPEALQESLEISRRCVTILQDSLNLLPLKKSAYQNVLLITPDSVQTAGFWQASCFPGKNLFKLMQKELAEVQHLQIGAAVSDSLLDIALEMSKNADLVAFLTLDAPADSLNKLVNAIHLENKPMLHFSIIPPVRLIPNISTWIVTGGVRRISLQAAVDVLFGRYIQTDHFARIY